MGIDRVLLAMEAEGMTLPPARTVRCAVVGVGPQSRPAAIALVGDLRDAGVPAATAYEDRPMKAQMKMADRAGATFVAILGERELADGVVTLRRLADGLQKQVPVGEAPRWLTRLDDWADA
jgi:histidyl-tRNA synthetase